MSGLNAPWFLQQFVDPANGKPLAGGKLYFFVAGSTTLPKNVYTDFALTMPWTQPLILDAGGYAPEYFMESGLYKVVVVQAGGNPDSPVYTRDNVSGTNNGGSVSSATYLTEIPSFPFGEGMLVDGSSDLWNDGCFVWWIPAKNIQRLKYFKMAAPGHAGPTSPGKYAIWKTDGVTSVKIHESQIPDARITDIDFFSAEVGSEWPFVVVACDPVYGTIPDYVKQMRLTVPSITSSPFPSNGGYIGSHVHNTEFSDSEIPAIKGVDPIYLMLKWMAVGAILQGE